MVLDAFSRKVVGWALDRTLEATLTIEALQMALRTRKPAAGLVHHSDRGVQYASGDYTDLLKAHGIQISMSRRGNPYDNAQCESFMKTLKYEEVYRNEYRDLAEARAQIGVFLDKDLQPKTLALGAGLPASTKMVTPTSLPARRSLFHCRPHLRHGLIESSLNVLSPYMTIRTMQTEVGPLIVPREVMRVEKWVGDAVAEGATLASGGRPIGDRLYEPTILVEPRPSSLVSTNEIFGPSPSSATHVTDRERIGCIASTASDIGSFKSHERPPPQRLPSCRCI